MANRSYRRNKRGQFASKGDSGARVTVGRAGGFANASFRSRVANNRAAAARRQALVRKGARAVGAAVAVGAAGTAIRRGVKSSPTGIVKAVVQTVRKF